MDNLLTRITPLCVYTYKSINYITTTHIISFEIF